MHIMLLDTLRGGEGFMLLAIGKNVAVDQRMHIEQLLCEYAWLIVM